MILLLLGCAALLQESGDQDHEKEAVELGALGTINVLRELDPSSFANRVTATASVEGQASRPEDTIDGGGKFFHPKADPGTPVVLTYVLPGLRTVSSLAIAWEYAGNDTPDVVRLEGCAGGTWTEIFRKKARKSEFLKCFKPATVDRLRLTLEGGGNRRVKEVFVYADPDVPLPKNAGALSPLRALWYDGKLQQHRSPENTVWTRPYGGKSFPHVPFDSCIPSAHDGAWGGSDKEGRRVFLRLELADAVPMAFGVVGSPYSGEARGVLAGDSRAEFYTADRPLDPSTIKGASKEDLTAQGWVLQKAWEKDASLAKSFPFAKPGRYRQILLVWDGLGVHPMPNAWSRLEVFGGAKP